MNPTSRDLQSQKINEYRSLKEPYKKQLADLTIWVLPNVYPGGTDSELLCESMVIKPGDSVLDVCTGNGIVALAAAAKGAGSVTGTDLNPAAIENAQYNKKFLKADNVSFTETHLFPNSTMQYDVITINPPYTDNQAADKTAICFWDKGNKVIKEFFKSLKRYLKSGGGAYITWSSFADQKILPGLARENNFNIHLINSRAGKSGFIYYVYRVTSTF